MRGISVGLAAILLSGAVSAATCPDTVRFMVPASPGGGYDQTARAMQKAMLDEKLARHVQVINVPGGGGTVGLLQLATQSRGDGQTLMIAANVMIGAILANRPPVTLADTRPVSRLTSEYEAIVVPANSRIQTIQDLVAMLKDNPGAVSWGGGSAGGIDHLTAALVAEAAGIDPRQVNYIAFSGGGEALASVLGGSVTVGVNTLSEFRDQIEAGQLRLLATTGDARSPMFDAPTLKESGLDVNTQTWRMVTAAPGVSDADYERLSACVAATLASASWQDTLSKRLWTPSVLAGEPFVSFVRDETALMDETLRKIGFIR